MLAIRYYARFTSAGRALRTLDGRPADERGSLPRELLGPAISDEFADLIESMLAADPSMRPTMDSILLHPKIAESDTRQARRRMLLAPVRAIKTMFAYMLRKFAPLASEAPWAAAPSGGPARNALGTAQALGTTLSGADPGLVFSFLSSSFILDGSTRPFLPIFAW